MRARTRGWSFMFLGYLLFATLGCESSAPAPAAASKGGHDHEHDHDHDHDHADGHAHGESAKGGDSHGADKQEGAVKKDVKAENFADALAQLAKLHATIRDGFAAKDIDSAHGPLHDVGHLLEQIPALAGKETEDKEILKQVQEAVDSLFDNYGAVDEKLHGEKGASYEEVAEKIDKALEQLKKISLTKADS